MTYNPPRVVHEGDDLTVNELRRMAGVPKAEVTYALQIGAVPFHYENGRQRIKWNDALEFSRVCQAGWRDRPKMSTPDVFLTVRQTARCACCDVADVNRAIKCGLLPAYEVNGQTVIAADDATRFRDRTWYRWRAESRKRAAA